MDLKILCFLLTTTFLFSCSNFKQLGQRQGHEYTSQNLEGYNGAILESLMQNEEPGPTKKDRDGLEKDFFANLEKKIGSSLDSDSLEYYLMTIKRLDAKKDPVIKAVKKTEKFINQKILWENSKGQDYIKTFSFAYLFTRDKKFRNLAAKVANHMQTHLANSDGIFYKSIDNGNIYPYWNGIIVDGLTMLYRATLDTKYLERSIRATDAIIANGYLIQNDPDKLYMAKAFLALYQVSGSREWLTRAVIGVKDSFENLNVSDEIELGRLLNLLSYYSGDKEFKETARHLLEKLSQEEPGTISNKLIPKYLSLYRELNSDPIHITIVGSKNDEDAKNLFRAALQYPTNYLRLEWFDHDEDSLINHDVEYPKLTRAAAYGCVDKVCSVPVYDPKHLLDEIKKISN